MKAYAFALIALLVLSGCATRTVYVYPELPLPEWPVLPVVFEAEFIDLTGNETGHELRNALPATAMVCVPSSGYEALAVRERIRQGDAAQLRDIIRAHNEGQK